MVNFLSSFLPNLRRLLIPIYDLQKKAKKFKWTEEAEKAFNDIKKLLISPPVFKAPTPDGLFWLESDTSREGVGGTLIQKQGDEWVVISYHSKRLRKSAKNFGVTELELTGLLVNIHGFMQLLHNRYFEVLVDHKAIEHMIKSKTESPTMRHYKMVPRNLITFLALLWITQHYTAERIITTKYKKTKVVNYRQQNNNLNILETCTFIDCDQHRTNYDGHINITRRKHALGIQYKHKSKQDIAGFISKLVARPEYGMIYQHKGMLLQNLHRRYLYILIKLPHLSDLEQRIPSFPNCNNYGSLTASNPDPLLDDTPTNDNKLHQVICNTFKIDYFQEMDIIFKLQNRLECKINYTLLALLPNKLNTMTQGLVTSGEGIRNKRAIPTLAIIQGIAAIGGMMIKGINALVDAKRASLFNNAIKLINENVQITHDRLITLENRTAMMAKAIIPVLKDFKQQINNTNDRLNRQY